MRRPSHTGTIEATADGRYRPRLPRSHGRRYLEPCDTYEGAVALLAVELECVAESPPEALTVAAWGKRWLEERAASGHYRATRTDQQRWRQHVDGSPLGDTALERLTGADVRRWTASLGGATQTRSNALSLLRNALRAAVEAGVVRANVAGDVRLPRAARARAGETWTWLRQPEIETLLAAALTTGREAERVHRWSMLSVAVYAGLRAGELRALRWESVDWDRGVLRVTHAVDEHGRLGPTKSGRPREVALLEPALGALERQRAELDESGRPNALRLVWPAKDTRPHARGYDAGLAQLRALGAVRRDVRFHDLRHTCASHLIQGTWAPTLIGRALRLEEVREVLGHTSIGVTQRYAHLSADGVHALVQRPTAGLRSGAPGPIRTGDLRFRKASAAPQIPLERAAIPPEIVQRLGHLAQAAREAIAARDPYAYQRALDLVEAVEGTLVQYRAKAHSKPSAGNP